MDPNSDAAKGIFRGLFQALGIDPYEHERWKEPMQLNAILRALPEPGQWVIVRDRERRASRYLQLVGDRVFIIRRDEQRGFVGESTPADFDRVEYEIREVTAGDEVWTRWTFHRHRSDEQLVIDGRADPYGNPDDPERFARIIAARADWT